MKRKKQADNSCRLLLLDVDSLFSQLKLFQRLNVWRSRSDGWRRSRRTTTRCTGTSCTCSAACTRTRRAWEHFLSVERIHRGVRFSNFQEVQERCIGRQIVTETSLQEGTLVSFDDQARVLLVDVVVAIARVAFKKVFPEIQAIAIKSARR